jgi:hypothetical protein
LKSLDILKHKTALNDLLNNPNFNWRQLLYQVVKMFTKLYKPDKEKYSVLIIDDTSKKKYGTKGEYVSTFYDHAKQFFFHGFQVIFSSICNQRTCIPVDFNLKIGKSKTKKSKNGVYSTKSSAKKRIKEAHKSKTKLSLSLIKRALKRNLEFSYVLWDSWYNCNESYKYVFEHLIPKGIHLISMVKLSKEKYSYLGNRRNVKELYKSAGQWKLDEKMGIKYKSILVDLYDKSDVEGKLIGKVRICFYRFPSQKNGKYKALLSTEINLTEIEILDRYTLRWSIEVMIKDLKQYFGFDQSKSSKYAPQVADLTIKCIFYIMLCSQKERHPEKSTEQLVFEFCNQFEEFCLEMFLQYWFIAMAKKFLEFSRKKGFMLIEELIESYEQMIEDFFEKEWFEDKIVEVDNCKKELIA